MDQENVRQIIHEMRRYRTELHTAEAKSAKNDHPDKLWKTISAFANLSSGGTIENSEKPFLIETIK